MNYRKTLFATLVLFIAILASSSCKKIEDNIIPDFKATVEGKEIQTNAVVAAKSDTAFGIMATKDSVNFFLGVKEFKNGKFTIVPLGDDAFATYTSGPSTPMYFAVSGEIEVLEAEDHGGNFNIKFHFTAVNGNMDTIHISNGEGKNIINPL